MNNKILLGLLVLVIGAAAGFFLLGSKGNTVVSGSPSGKVTATTPPSASNSQSSVQLTDSGFSPATITVSQGTTVTFTNTSSGQMWVASDPHPVHTLLPGFDELTSVGNGGSYTYTFTKMGTWTYHNHMNPVVKGTVVVTQ